jgi:hypothetical protein
LNTATVPVRDLAPLIPLEAVVKALPFVVTNRCRAAIRVGDVLRHSPIFLPRRVSSVASSTVVGELPLIDLVRRGLEARDQLAAELDRVADWIKPAYQERRDAETIIGK